MSTSEEQKTVAKTLRDLSDPTFPISLKHNGNYIVLEEQMGASQNHKNAVSILKNRVSFMVADWDADAEKQANQLGLPTSRSEKFGKRLEFPKLTSSDIERNSQLFKTLLSSARTESRSRQGM